MEKLAESYEGKNEGVTIEINQVGSSAGIKDAINGVSEIGMASRELKDQEKAEVKGTAIAYDGIALIMNKSNTVKDLTMDQIKGIYTDELLIGKIGGKRCTNGSCIKRRRFWNKGCFPRNSGYESEELTKEAMISNGNGGVKKQ